LDGSNRYIDGQEKSFSDFYNRAILQKKEAFESLFFLRY